MVNVHSEYRDLAPWSGPETADLVYEDIDSVLTKILIDAGYLSQRGWEGATPTYFIEVKTTAGTCETPFYMSNSQYIRVSLFVPFIYRIMYTEISRNPDAVNETWKPRTSKCQNLPNFQSV